MIESPVVQQDLQDLIKRNPALAPKPGGTEGDIRLKLLAKCKHGQFQLADPDGAHRRVSWTIMMIIDSLYFSGVN